MNGTRPANLCQISRVKISVMKVYSQVMDPDFLNPSTVMDTISGICNRIDYQFDIRQKVQKLKDYAWAHPFWAMFIMATVAVLTVPVGAFVIFAGGTIAFTFAGFIFVEGTLLTIGAVFMIAILAVLGFISLSFAGCVFVVYFLLSGGLTFLSTTTDKLKMKMNQRRQKSGHFVDDVTPMKSPEHQDDYVVVKGNGVQNGMPRSGTEEELSDALRDG